MAANLNSTRGIANFGKRLVNQFITRDPTHSSSSSTRSAFRRSAHTSAYDKNVDDQVRPAVVPDDVIQPESDKYWAPHPRTGVFGPATENHESADGDSPANGRDESVLEEKAWFRPTSLEDLEKPLHP
ncbi:hypothetical protein LWI29_005279 [Acer saccharum]|uniref:Late embryogenesis abundant protein n=1 Tax=Acer saccharum TaxID=4024 RepID=A0AA39SCD0_ACESA|nr:hypothetical protein LWI29_005279 [Acer saccharum]KAK1562203.1 hypothetical protein Q3G72_008052 [Acer saccharum]